MPGDEGAVEVERFFNGSFGESRSRLCRSSMSPDWQTLERLVGVLTGKMLVELTYSTRAGGNPVLGTGWGHR